jgi:hypothetical protein
MKSRSFFESSFYINWRMRSGESIVQSLARR